MRRYQRRRMVAARVTYMEEGKLRRGPRYPSCSAKSVAEVTWFFSQRLLGFHGHAAASRRLVYSAPPPQSRPQSCEYAFLCDRFVSRMTHGFGSLQ